MWNPAKIRIVLLPLRVAVEEIREGTVRTEVIEDRDTAIAQIEALAATDQQAADALREDLLSVTTIVDREPEPSAPSDPPYLTFRVAVPAERTRRGAARRRVRGPPCAPSDRARVPCRARPSPPTAQLADHAPKARRRAKNLGWFAPPSFASLFELPCSAPTTKRNTETAPKR